MATRKLIVEVCNAHHLMPKDGQGSSSPYVQVDYDGQRRRTTTKIKDLNPVWDEKLEFLIADPSEMADECLEANIYNEKKNGKRSNFLGRVRIPGSSFVKKGEEALMNYALEKRGLFSHIKGELGMKVYYVDVVPSPPPSPKPEDQKPAEAAPAPAEETPASDAPPPPADAPPPPAAAEGGSEPAPPAAAEPDPSPSVAAGAAGEEQEEGRRREEMKVEESLAMAPARVLPADYYLRETTPSLGAILGDKICTYDLVEKMQYLYVRVVKAKALTCTSDPCVRVSVGSHAASASARAVAPQPNPEWHRVFAFEKARLGSAHMLEVSLWDGSSPLGIVWFDLQEVPARAPPDSPLAPQWYKLEPPPDHGQEGGHVRGNIMLAVWVGTQADEAFPEAWQSDSGGVSHTRSKVYLSPKLWYLRVNVIEAQDLQQPAGEQARAPDTFVRAYLGFQSQRTKPARQRSLSPFWNEDLLFVAAEPFEEQLLLVVSDRMGRDRDETFGQTRISLHTVERRLDHRQVLSRWFNLEKANGDQQGAAAFRGRIHLRVCFDGGYHVMDEAAHLCSDLRPTAKQLWRPMVGVLELGILGGQGLLPMKTKEGRGVTDAYAVAKYGPKWVRTRTVMDSFSPRWNEQYTWEVYDPCTVLSVGVFDNGHVSGGEGKEGRKDVRIGKVRVRLSTLESDRVYTNSYPLLVLHPAGAKKMGELELAVRFSTTSLLSSMLIYAQPLLPRMHYLHPLGISQQDHLRQAATHMVSMRLARAEPPLHPETVQFMLDTHSNLWSMRRSKANWFRIMSVLSSLLAIARWTQEICLWRNPVTTVLVHLLFLILVWFPELILPTLCLYMFFIGSWHYRLRPRAPPHMDARISHADAVGRDELDEEFDTVPTSAPAEVVRARYERLRDLAGRVQTVLGDVATQGERLQALLSWRDPRATTIFIFFCLLSALVLYVTPVRAVVVMLGLYILRHPKFRELNPPAALNFYRRLPALSDRIL